MNTTSGLVLSRRTALAAFGASVSLAASSIALAGGAHTSPALLSLDDVALAWPRYHPLDGFETPLHQGRAVSLRREAHHPFDDQAVAVYTDHDERLGYIERRHAPAVRWALERSDRINATISKLTEPVRDGRRIGGWGNVRLDIRVEQPQETV